MPDLYQFMLDFKETAHFNSGGQRSRFWDSYCPRQWADRNSWPDAVVEAGWNPLSFSLFLVVQFNSHIFSCSMFFSSTCCFFPQSLPWDHLQIWGNPWKSQVMRSAPWPHLTNQFSVYMCERVASGSILPCVYVYIYIGILYIYIFIYIYTYTTWYI